MVLEFVFYGLILTDFHWRSVFFSNFKNNFPLLVFIVKEKGILNHTIFLLLFLFSSFRVCSSLFFFFFSSSLKLLLRSAFSNLVFAASKKFWFLEISVIHLLNTLGSSLKTFDSSFKIAWPLKEISKVPSIKWNIVKIVYRKTTLPFCKLCLTEKLFILNALGDDKSLNKITEFVNKWGHRNNLLVKNVKDRRQFFCFWIFC